MGRSDSGGRGRRFVVAALMAAAALAMLAALVVDPHHAGAASSAGAPTAPPAGTPTCTIPVTSLTFTADGHPVTHLRGSVREGQSVTASFVVPANCTAAVRLTSFYEATPRFGNPNTDQTLDQRDARSFPTGAWSLGPVTVPGCNFQIDFTQIIGGVPVVLDATNSGRSACATPSASATTVCSVGSTTPEAVVTVSDDGPGSDTFSISDETAGTVPVVVPVAPGGTVSRTLVVARSGDTVLVTDDQVPPSHPWTFVISGSCSAPVVSASFACAAGTPTATFLATNPAPAGSPASTVTITRGATVVAETAVAAGATAVTAVAYSGAAGVGYTVSGPHGLHSVFTSTAVGPCDEVTTTSPSTTSTSTSVPSTSVPTSTSVPSSTVPPSTVPAGGTPTTLGSGPPGTAFTAAATGSPAVDPSQPAAPVVLSTRSPSTGLLAFTGLNVRTLLTWVMLLTGSGALLVLLSAHVRRHDPDVPLP